MLASACSEPLGLEDLAGTYVLTTVEDKPAADFRMNDGVREFRRLADTIFLAADGSGSRVSVREIRVIETGVVTVQRHQEDLSVGRKDGMFRATVDLGASAALFFFDFNLYGDVLWMKGDAEYTRR
jgi:hypothetical protein